METKKNMNGFMLFGEQEEAFTSVSREEAGELIVAVFKYVNEGKMPEFSGALMGLFRLMACQIDRSRDAYEQKCANNRRNANKRYRKTTEEEDAAVACERMPSHPNASERMPPHPTACHPNNNPNPSPKHNPKPNPNIDDATNVSIINMGECDVKKEDEDVVEGSDNDFDQNLSFNRIWELYGKPVGDTTTLRKMWDDLPSGDKRSIFEYVPKYVRRRPDPKYRKDFINFLSCRTWEQEPIVEEKQPANYGISGTGYQANEGRRAAAYRETAALIARNVAECERETTGADFGSQA